MTVAGTTTSLATNVTVNTSNAFLYLDSTFAAPTTPSRTAITPSRPSQGRYARRDTSTANCYLPSSISSLTTSTATSAQTETKSSSTMTKTNSLPSPSRTLGVASSDEFMKAKNAARRICSVLVQWTTRYAKAFETVMAVSWFRHRTRGLGFRCAEVAVEVVREGDGGWEIAVGSAGVAAGVSVLAMAVKVLSPFARVWLVLAKVESR